MPATLPDGTQVPTVGDINSGLDNPNGNQGGITGFWPVDLWDFLFGSGHAGSCGAFREQYFGYKSVLDPILDGQRAVWAAMGPSYFNTPNAVMDAVHPSVLANFIAADNQFDQFKGSNLLGQCMFASRLYDLFFRSWLMDELFGTAQYFQFWLDASQQEFKSIGAAIDNLSINITDLNNRTQFITQDEAAIGAIKANLTEIYQRLYQVQNIDIPGLSQAITGIDHELQTAIEPDLVRIMTDIGDDTTLKNTSLVEQLQLTNQHLVSIRNRLTQRINRVQQNVLQKIRDINQQVIPGIEQQIAGIDQFIPSIEQIPNIQSQITDLQKRTTGLEQQKTSTVLPQLANLAQAIAQIVNTIQTEIQPEQALHDQQITNIFNYLSVTLNNTIIQIETSITNITNIFNLTNIVNITIIQQFFTDIDVYIKNVIRSSCDIIYKCLQTGRHDNPQDVCQEGRDWWGQWAECWLQANTDDTTVGGEGLSYVVDIPSIRSAVQGAAGAQSTGRWADKVALCREVVLAGLADTLPRGALAGSEGIEGSPFIFEATP